MHYAAIHVTCVHVNRLSDIPQAAAIAVNRTKGVVNNNNNNNKDL